MATYAGDQTYVLDVYIIKVPDNIIGGISGYDVLPFIDLQDTSSYLKKYKGYLIVGTGTPSGSYGIQIDSDYQNILYFDQSTGSWWKTGTQSFTWVNITKDCILNVKGIVLNNNGNEAQYGNLNFDIGDQTLYLKNYLNRPLNIKVGELKFDSADAITETQVQVEDSEIMLNDQGVTEESLNSSAQYAVKNFKTVLSSEVPSDRYFRWDESRRTFQLIDKHNDLLYLNCSTIYNNKIPMSIEWDIVISNQTELDALLNTVGMVVVEGQIIVIDNSFPYRTIFIKQGTYQWKNKYIIQKEHFTLYSERDTIFTLTNAFNFISIGEIVIGSYNIGFNKLPLPPNAIGAAVIDTAVIQDYDPYLEPMIKVEANHVNLKLKVNGGRYEIPTFVEIHSGHNTIDLDLIDCTCRYDFAFVSTVQSTGNTNINNNVEVKEYLSSNVNPVDIMNVNDSFIEGKYQRDVTNLTNNVFNCMRNSDMMLMVGTI